MSVEKEEKGKTESGRQSMGMGGGDKRARKCSQSHQLVLWSAPWTVE